ncbi:hypothetical protein Tco_0534380 [Tanacetum coccineum]
MTRSSKKELVEPYKEPERVLHSTRKLSKTTSLDYSSSPEFELFSDHEVQFEEEITDTMGEPNMEKYMMKIREDYGSGIARPNGSKDEDANEHIERVLKILRNEPAGSITTWEILKGNFLSKYCPPSRTAKRMEEINNFQQKADETLYQAWERFKELLLRCPQHYLTNMQEVILFYKGLDVPTRQILDSKGDVPKMSAINAKKAIQEMADHSQKWHDGTSTRNKSGNTSDGLAAIHAQLNNLGREIKKVNERVYASQVRCESCNGPHYTKDCPLKEERKILEKAYYTQFGVPFPQEARYKAVGPGFYQRDNGNPSYQERRQTMEETLNKKGSGGLPGSTKTNPRDHAKSITTTEEAETPSIRRIGSNRYAASNQQRDDMMSLTELSRANITFPGRLKEYGYDEKEVLRESEKLQVSSTESASSLKRLLGEKWRIEEEIKAKMNEHCSRLCPLGPDSERDHNHECWPLDLARDATPRTPQGLEVIKHIKGESTSDDAAAPPTIKWTKTIALKGELRIIKLDDQTMDAYSQKIESITIVLTNLGSPMSNDDVFTYALHGLSDKYDQVAGIIAHRDPFLDLSTVQYMITTEEMRLNFKFQPTLTDTSPSSPTILLAETNARRGNRGLDARSRRNEPEVCFNFPKGFCRFGGAYSNAHQVANSPEKNMLKSVNIKLLSS